MVKLYELLSKAMFDLTKHTLIEAFTIDSMGDVISATV
jgi:hypothetical protein